MKEIRAVRARRLLLEARVQVSTSSEDGHLFFSCLLAVFFVFWL